MNGHSAASSAHFEAGSRPFPTKLPLATLYQLPDDLGAGFLVLMAFFAASSAAAFSSAAFFSAAAFATAAALASAAVFSAVASAALWPPH